MMPHNDVNHWALSGLLAGPAEFEAGGEGRTRFGLINNQKTSDGKGKVSEYRLCVTGDQRALLAAQGDRRIVVEGFCRMSQYNADESYCLATSVKLEAIEGFDLNRCEVSGLLAGPVRVGALRETEITQIPLRICREGGTRMKYNSIVLPVLGDKRPMLQQWLVHNGDRLTVKGRLWPGGTTPIPMGWMIVVDTASQKWRQRSTVCRPRVAGRR